MERTSLSAESAEPSFTSPQSPPWLPIIKSIFFARSPRHTKQTSNFSSLYQHKRSHPHSAHHHRLGQALVRGADGAQGPSKEPAQRWRQRGGRQGQAVQLRVGSFPEGPVDQGALPLEGLLLSGLCCKTPFMYELGRSAKQFATTITASRATFCTSAFRSRCNITVPH